MVRIGLELSCDFVRGKQDYHGESEYKRYVRLLSVFHSLITMRMFLAGVPRQTDNPNREGVE